jgi:hypothetical protein
MTLTVVAPAAGSTAGTGSVLRGRHVAEPGNGTATDGNDTGMETEQHDARTPTEAEVRERLRRRAAFLRDLADARALRARVTPHRSRRARIHAALRMRTYRVN